MKGFKAGAAESARIFKKVRQTVYAATLATLEKAAEEVCVRMKSFAKYHNITGNALTSTTVGVFYKGRCVSLFNVGGYNDPPTRKTLRKGEYYDLPQYYGGGDVGDSPYKGTYGEGGQWGPTLGPWAMRRTPSQKRKTWNLVVMVPVSYAEYNPRITGTLQSVMDKLPDIVDYNVVSVEKAPSQTDVFKDVPF